MVDDTKYRIGRLPHGQLLSIAHFLHEGGLRPVIPYYTTTRRMGKSRRRIQVNVQVLPGIIFIPDHEHPHAQALAQQINHRIGWLLDSTRQNAPALCTADDIRPLFDWIRSRLEDANARPLHPADGFYPGQDVTVNSGPMEGHRGVILTRTMDGQHISVEFQGKWTISLPYFMLTATADK